MLLRLKTLPHIPKMLAGTPAVSTSIGTTLSVSLADWLKLLPDDVGTYTTIGTFILTTFLVRAHLKKSKLERELLKAEILVLKIQKAMHVDTFKQRKKENLPLRRDIDRIMGEHVSEHAHPHAKTKKDD